MNNDFASAQKHTGSALWFITSKRDGTIINSAMSYEWCKETMERIQSDYSRLVS